MVGVDISQPMIHKAKEREIPNAEFIVSDCASPDFVGVAEQFDIVTTNYVIMVGFYPHTLN